MKLLTDYRISEARLTKAEQAEQSWLAIESAWDAYAGSSPPQRRRLFKRLTLGQRAFVALNGLEAEVSNGGIHQYLWNSTGDIFEEALAGLRLIGALKHFRLLQRTIELFPESATLKTRRSRQRALRSIGEERLARIFDEPFFALESRKRTKLDAPRIAYLKKHLGQFVLPPGVPEQTPRLLSPKQDYRVPAKMARLRGEKLQRAVVREFWDLYLEALDGTQEEFLGFVNSLSPGQRALAPLLVLKNRFNVAGFGDLFGSYSGYLTFLISEVRSALQMMQATPYVEAFDKALSAAGNLPELQRKLSAQGRALDEARKAKDPTEAKACYRTWLAGYRGLLKRARAPEIDEPLQSSTEAFQGLLTSVDHNLDRFLEKYIDAKYEQFFV